MKYLFLVIAMMVGVQLAAESSPTNRYGLYLWKTPEGYVLKDRERLKANESIQPNTKYAYLLRQTDCFVPYSDSMAQTVSLPAPQYEVSTKEFLLKKIEKRNLSVKVDLPVGVTQSCPFVVFIHGGGWHIGNEEGLAEQSHAFAANGIAGVRVSYTLIPEGGNIHTVLAELQEALKFVFSHVDEWGLDMSRFGFLGDSAGGYLSSYMAMTTPGTKAYIGVCGMYNLLNIADGYFPGVEGWTKFFQTEDLDSLKSYSPIYRIPDNPPATLLMHGTADPTINCRQSKDFADAIAQKGGHAELALYEGYGHLFSLSEFSDCSNAALLRAVTFAQQAFDMPSAHLSSKLFRAGDRVSFIGNSITQNGYHLRYLMLYYATRFPAMTLTLNSAGISGDTTEDINRRMGVDILPQQPDVAIMMSGMNDAFRYVPIADNDSLEQQKRAKSVAKYESEYTEALSSLLTNGRRIVLFTPSIYDDKTAVEGHRSGHVNPTLSAYADKVRSWGAKHRLPVVDMWQGLMDINEDLLAENPMASVIGYDRVHPSHFGGFMMAYLFLRDLQEQTIVSEVCIDRKKKEVALNKASLLSAVQYEPKALSFRLLEQSLPFPVDSLIGNAVNYVPFQEEMNRQMLKIENLKGGRYELRIDNRLVGNYDSKELTRGINLAENRTTPQYQQAEEVSKLCEQLRVAFSDYRNLKLVEYNKMGVNFDFNDVDACLQKINQLIKDDTNANSWMKSQYTRYLENKPKEALKLQHIAELQKQIYQRAQPEAHNYIISLVD